ncbi:V8-like Glu-specific endopeptidase [Crossiella equi]|uniref:V8-like Glu-specific endopeptidase n=1 Tax=Crossiella equi TaxID=130796 RepID=A0ABS5AHE0_9PSEU|nr:serine protease [Crossiella equi]MBP2475782.1 V8-like Glu-specific endopeptidase [Crossiella equi]
MNRIAKLMVVATMSIPAAGSFGFVPPNAPEAVASVPQDEKVGTEEITAHTIGGGDSTLTLRRAESGYVKAHVTGLKLAEGDVLRISDPAGKESYTYTGKDDLTASPDATGFWAMSVTGDTAVLTLRGKDGGAPSAASTATVDKLTRGFTPAEFSAQEQRQTRSICGSNNYQDVACYQTSSPTEFAKTKPVAKLLRNGSSLCTAWRVGAKNRMLTNNHCFTSTTGIEVWFNYQCPTCNGTTSTPTKVLASKVLSTDAGLDYTLYEVNDFNAISGFGYLELDARVPNVGERMYVIGHPAGKLKKLSLKDDQSPSGNCQVRAVRVNGSSSQSDISYMCDTEGGSSGSPVLSGDTHKVIALHHFGGCPNQGVRIDLVAQKIGSLL